MKTMLTPDVVPESKKDLNFGLHFRMGAASPNRRGICSCSHASRELHHVSKPHIKQERHPEIKQDRKLENSRLKPED